MTTVRSLLVDVRETDDLRGFHALAALYLMAGRVRPVELYRLGGETPDERIACEAFCFDTGLHLSSGAGLIGSDHRFDVYLFAADVLPWDEISINARHASRRTVGALMFGLREFQPAFDGVVVVGHDTAGIAAAVLTELQPGWAGN